MEYGKDRGLAYKGREFKGVYERGGKYQARVWEKDTNAQLLVGTYDSPEEAHYNRLVHMNGHHWEGIEHDERGAWGFIYIITQRSTGKMYIGKKQYRLWNSTQGGYKCTDPRDDFWFDESLWRPNDWKLYTGSSKNLNAEIWNMHDFKFEVLSLHYDRLELHLAETMLLAERNVLEALDEDGSYKYWNENIAGELYRPPFLKADMVNKRSKSELEMKRYYLKPKVCPVCLDVLQYPGNGRCENGCM